MLLEFGGVYCIRGCSLTGLPDWSAAPSASAESARSSHASASLARRILASFDDTCFANSSASTAHLLYLSASDIAVLGEVAYSSTIVEHPQYRKFLGSSDG